MEERDFNYDDLVFETAHDECAYCTEFLILAFRSFKITVANSISTGMGDHHAAVSLCAGEQN